MKRLLISLLAGLLVIAGGCASRNVPKENTDIDPAVTEAFAEYQKDELVSYLKASKLSAHYAIKDLSVYGLADEEATLGTADEDFDFSAMKDSLASLEKISRAKLSRADQNVYDRYKKYLEKQLAYEGLTDYYFYFSPGNGLNVNFITNFTEYVIRNERDIKDVITYLKESRGYLASCLEHTKEQAGQGIAQSAETMQGIIDQCQKFIDTKGKTAVATVLNQQVAGADYLNDQQKADYQAAISQACDEVLVAGYQDVADYYTEAKKTASGTGALASWDGGKKYYEALLADNSSSSLTPKEAEKLLNTFIESQVSKLQTLYSKDPTAYDSSADYGYAKPEEILEHIKFAMTNDFPAAADVNYAISYLDPSVASDSIVAYYVNPPLDDFKDNVIKVNPGASDDLYTTLAHEGYPGHCYQITYELANHYSPLLAMMSFIGYTEGWAVYVEGVALEYSKITNADTVAMNAIESVLFYPVMANVDIMVNYDGATAADIEEYVSQFYGEGTGEQLFNLAAEDPGMYLPYGLGYAQMTNLANNAKDKLGSKFDLKSYHQAVLDAGTCDFDYLKEALNEYIKSNK